VETALGGACASRRSPSALCCRFRCARSCCCRRQPQLAALFLNTCSRPAPIALRSVATPISRLTSGTLRASSNKTCARSRTPAVSTLADRRRVFGRTRRLLVPGAVSCIASPSPAALRRPARCPVAARFGWQSTGWCTSGSSSDPAPRAETPAAGRENTPPSLLSLECQVLGNGGQTLRKDRQLKLRHGSVSPFPLPLRNTQFSWKRARLFFRNVAESLADLRSSESPLAGASVTSSAGYRIRVEINAERQRGTARSFLRSWAYQDPQRNQRSDGNVLAIHQLLFREWKGLDDRVRFLYGFRVDEEDHALAISARVPFADLAIQVELHSCPSFSRHHGEHLRKGHALLWGLNDEDLGSFGYGHAR
jgi:hypothetical protein